MRWLRQLVASESKEATIASNAKLSEHITAR